MDYKDLESLYWEKGYVIIKRFFSKDEISLMKDDFDFILKKASEFTKTAEYKNSVFVLDQKHTIEFPIIKRVNWCIEIAKNLERFSAKKELVKLVSNILSSKSIEQIICQTHYKIPNDGVKYPWHQDTQKDKGNWKDVNNKGSFVLTMVAIDNCNKENGAVKVIPKSHLSGRLNIESDIYNQNNDRRIDPLIKKYGIEYLEMDQGDIALMGPYTIHSSEENLSNYSRRMFMSGYIYPGAQIRTNSENMKFRTLST